MNDTFENSGVECPLDYNTVETYLQVFHNSYLLNVGFQSNESTIADVIPGIIKLKSELTRMELDPETKRLAILIIKALNAKFDFELNSDVYKVYN